MTFKVDTRGEERLFQALASGMAEWADEAGALVYAVAPSDTGRYKQSIGATTYLDGEVVAGEDVKITRYTGADKESGFGSRRGGTATVRAVVYSTSPLSHLLELGTAPHEIPIPIDTVGGFHGERVIQHPGARRKPHFVPGMLASRAIAGGSIARGIAKVDR